MDQSDHQFLRDKAAECRERAARARDDKDRSLWLELADEIAGRLPQWPDGRTRIANWAGYGGFGNA